MTSQHWQLVKRLFHQAEERPPGERVAFLREASKGDRQLFDQVWSLLSSDTGALSFLDNARVEVDATLAPGCMLGPYRILEPIGSGGSATVYLAAHQGHSLCAKVAIKVLTSGWDTATVLNRFKIEQDITQHLIHPNIVNYFDSGRTADNRPYMVMEYIEGQKLSSYVQSNRLSLAQRLKLFLEICDAVHAAHQNLIIHRDLKPGNILVDGKGHPKLVDFGISKILDPGNRGQDPLTRLQDRPLTLEYASPEQISGAVTTTASDVYSLGVILYEILTGVRPFMEKELGSPETRQAILSSDPKPPSQKAKGLVPVQRSLGWRILPAIPKDLDIITLKALRKDPARRYGSVAGMSRDVERYLQGFPIQARQESFAYVCSKMMRRHALAVSLTVASILVLIAFSTTLFFQQRATSRERDRAERVSEFLLNIFESADPYLANGKKVTAEDLLSRAVVDIESDLKEDPHTKARLLTTMAGTFKTLGNFPKAKSLLEQAQRLQNEKDGPHPLDQADTLSKRAEIYAAEHQPQRAEIAYRQALSLLEKHGHANPKKLAMVVGGYAIALADQQKYQDAYPLFNRAIETLSGIHSASAQVVLANVYDRLAKVHSDQGDYLGAEVNLKKALALKEAYHHTEHPGIANILNNLAVLYQKMGRSEEVEAPLLRSLALTEKAFGKTHRKTLSVMGNLGIHYMNIGQFDKAEAYQEQTLFMLEQNYPEDRWGWAIASNNLGRVYQEKGDYKEAEIYIQNAYSACQEIKDLPEIKTLPFMVNVASIYGDLGDFKEAGRLFAKGFSLAKKHLPDDHPMVAKLYDFWGVNLLAEKQFFSAHQAFVRAFTIYWKILPKNSPAVFKSLNRLITTSEKTGQSRLADRLRNALQNANQPTFQFDGELLHQLKSSAFQTFSWPKAVSL